MVERMEEEGKKRAHPSRISVLGVHFQAPLCKRIGSESVPFRQIAGDLKIMLDFSVDSVLSMKKYDVHQIEIKMEGTGLNHTRSEKSFSL